MKRKGIRGAGSAHHPTTKERRGRFTNPLAKGWRARPMTTHVCEGNERAHLIATKMHNGRTDGITRPMMNIQEIVVAE